MFAKAADTDAAVSVQYLSQESALKDSAVIKYHIWDTVVICIELQQLFHAEISHHPASQQQARCTAFCHQAFQTHLPASCTCLHPTVSLRPHDE